MGRSTNPGDAALSLSTALLRVENVNDYFTVVGELLPPVCGADFHNLLIVNPRLGMFLRHFGPGFPQHVFDAYSGQQAKSDLMLQRGLEMSPGEVIHLAALQGHQPTPPGWQQLDQSFRQKSGFVDAIAVVLYRELEGGWGAGLVLYRRAPRPAFEPEHANVMRKLGPLLAAGFDSAWRRAQLGACFDTLTDIFFRYGNLTFLVNRHGTPTLLHESAARLLRLLYPKSEAEAGTGEALPEPLRSQLTELIDVLERDGRTNLVSGEARSSQGLMRLYVTPKHDMALGNAAFQVVILCEPGFANLRNLRRAGITERQIDVLELLQRGLSSSDIGRQLGISENGVKFHLKKLSQKLEAAGKAEILARAMARSLELAVELGMTGGDPKQ